MIVFIVIVVGAIVTFLFLSIINILDAPLS